MATNKLSDFRTPQFASILGEARTSIDFVAF